MGRTRTSDLTGDVPGATQEDLFGHDARPRPAGKQRPAKKTKSDATASTGGSSASTQFGELMEQELRLKREAAERAFETQAEKDRTLMRLEELSNESALGAVLLVFWLVALFYLLGNTAADYFCLSLRKMSGLLRLSPAVAGVSLLPLGNGAPDVFASVVSFVGNGNGEVGLNSVLGGAVFVTCVVVGVVAICVGDQGVRIDKKAFLRDVGFFMFTLVFLLLMLFVGRVSFVVAVMFVSIYVVYAVFVAANEIVEKHVRRLKMDIPLRVGNIFSQEEDSVQTSLLDVETEDDGSRNSNALPEWMWASNVAIYSNQMKLQEHERHLWGWQDDGIEEVETPWSIVLEAFVRLLEFPLTVLERMLGTGLVALYLVFLSVRLAGATGILPLAGLSKS
ncbi:cation/calcium exchanger 4-like protein [Tanacetum coccineum]